MHSPAASSWCSVGALALSCQRAATRLLWCVAAAGALAAPALTQRADPADGRERAYQSNNAGAAWLERFEFATAADAFREALRLNPSLGIARFNLALALFYDGQADAAEREARAAAAAISSPHADYLLGLIARHRGQHATAAAAFARVLQRDPLDAATAILLGQEKLQQGDATGSIVQLEAALALEPHNVTGTYTLSVALSRAGRAEEARRVLGRFQQLRESGTGITLGNGYLEQGRYAEAVVSTGAERDLVSPQSPAVRFTLESLTAAGYGGANRSPKADGQRVDAPALDAAARRAVAAAAAGGVGLIDYDNDGDPDLLEAAPDGDRLWRNAGGRFTLTSVRLPRRFPGAVTTGFVSGDLDNDGRADVLALRYGGPTLYRNAAGARFIDVTSSSGIRSRPTELPLAAALADADHDGDLDILIPGFVDLDASRTAGRVRFPDGFAGSPTRLWRNNGNGTFTDVAATARITAARAVAAAPTDFDLQRDVDLAVVGHGGLALFKNLRDGSFREVSQDVGLGALASVSALAAGDVNRDGRPDFLLAQSDGAIVATSHGRTRFVPVPVAGTAALAAAQLFDYDNDGLLDVMAWTRTGPQLLRSIGTGWRPVPDAIALPPGFSFELPSPAAGRAIAVADLDGDGDQDLVVQHRSGVAILRNEGGHRGGSVTVRLSGQVSNRSGAGSKLEVRAGALLQRRETALATPPVVPHDLVFGLGGRARVDAVRVLWPAGVVQAELGVGKALLVTELNRKPSSCPYLFTWNGSEFEFVTDFLGGGELGYWAAPGVRGHPDPDEYVRVPAPALQPRDGRYELRVTNELEEVLYLDHLGLIAVAHPDGTEVFPNEGLVSPPFPPATLHVVTRARPPLAVVDDHGHDVGGAAAAVDRRAPDDFRRLDIRGYAEPHGLTVRVDATADVLLVTGWTDYAFSSDNVAASHRGLQLSPPALQVRTRAGAWRTAVPEIGVPAGRPQTIVIDLRRRELEGHREFRIVTNMRIYWDRIAAADAVSAPQPVEGVRAAARPIEARLAWRGFSAEASPDGRDPFAYDYTRTSSDSPWKAMVGRYTAEGDVEPLLRSVDGRFVVARPGDEVAIAFDAAAPPSIPAGWTRTFLLYASGFSKEMDLNSASPDVVEPLPFHGMHEYPPARAGLPAHPAERRSRTVTTAVPSIDTLLLPVVRDRREERHRGH